MKTLVFTFQRRLRILAFAAAGATIFAFPAGLAFARGGHSGGHGGGGHAGGHVSARAAVAHGGFGTGGMHSSGISHARYRLGAGGQFANSGRHNLAHQRNGRSFAGHSIRSVRSGSGSQLARRVGQHSGNLNHPFVTAHHRHHHHSSLFFSSFGFGPYYYGYGYYPYYQPDVCNPYSRYYDPVYCQQLYYQGY